jgi:hypothetical protein
MSHIIGCDHYNYLISGTLKWWIKCANLTRFELARFKGGDGSGKSTEKLKIKIIDKIMDIELVDDATC